MSLPQPALDTPLSRRSVGYNTVSGSEHICHSDGAPQGSIVGLLLFLCRLRVSGVERNAFAKGSLNQNKTLWSRCFGLLWFKIFRSD